MASKLSSRAAPQPPPPPPPRTLDVQKFAEARLPELTFLHAVVSDRIGGNFRIRRGKRRRTGGHRGPRAKRPRVGLDESAEGGGEREGKRNKVASRRARRSAELRSNRAVGFTAARDGTRRLRTHLWHAKRFKMVKRWGFYLPLGLHGRGKGSRAVWKWLQKGAVVHDASYYFPIQLEGPEDSILSILRMVLLPTPPEISEVSDDQSQQVIHGVRYQNAMLYHVGAPRPHLVGPVMYMWRPSVREDNLFSTEGGDLVNGCCTPSEEESSSLPRKLWIWIHAAAFEEGHDALSFACRKQMHDCGVSVGCSAIEGRIARLDIMGDKAVQILQKILQPISEFQISENTSTLEHPFLTACTSSGLQKAFILDHAEHLQSYAILSLTVNDPRGVPIHGNECSSKGLSASDKKMDVQHASLDSNNFVAGSSQANESTLSSLWLKPGKHGIFLSDSKHLWDSTYQIGPPIPENVLCTEMHQRRLKFFYLDSSDHQEPPSEEKDGFNRSCPIILLRHPEHRNFSMGWSLVIPMSWVKPFWFSLVLHGARPIGLRERRWIAWKNNLPSFPHDFPDCKAYSSFMADEAAEFDRAAELHPPAVRPLRVPIPPPWNCIANTAGKGHVILRCLESVKDCEDEASSSTKDVASSQILIPRTAKILNQYLENMDKCPSLPSGEELCLVRVLLCPCNAGAFEDGAIVCGPVSTDLSAWESRSKEQEDELRDQWQLQLPQSSIGSYFTRLEMGQWELQPPKDPAGQQSFRWPIGFVTTGFVQGSSKRLAIALCEVKLLAILRRQQWIQTQVRRPEVFVLVRNMRSAAYRRALATIILERQKEDIESM